jgi:hypothetical protein
MTVLLKDISFELVDGVSRGFSSRWMNIIQSVEGMDRKG